MDDLESAMNALGQQLTGSISRSNITNKLKLAYGNCVANNGSSLDVEYFGSTISKMRMTSACAGAKAGDRIAFLSDAPLCLAVGIVGKVDDESLTWQSVYPVGAIYLSYEPTSPASLFGGSWTQITGRFLRMANDVSTGGADTHTHGLSSGFAKIGATGYASNSIGYVASATSTMGSTSAYTIQGTQLTGTRQFNHWTPLAGNSNSGSSMPAYQDLYAWRRTA